MGVELIKDSRGKDHMVFNKDNSKVDDLMGDKVSDYEILQVLGEGSFGFVAKAKSRLNHKIYAIKQINFNNLKSEKAMELSKNEMVILKNLNHPLITKYYKSIEDGNCLYIIMEFMNNGDLSGLIKAHKILNKPIEEEKLWNIFIQAMKSLVYIHKNNLIHRDIKPENLFINNDGTVKLGDFGVSASMIEKNKNKIENARKEFISNWICKGTCVGTPPFMSPEMIKKAEYDLKTDVYSMGCSFFESMYWMFPRTPVMDVQALFGGGSDLMKLVDLPIKNNKDYYSKELVNIIKKMIEIDKNKRPSSEEVLNMLIHEFNKKYSQNSSIGSILCCLYSYQNLTQYYLEEKNQNYINENYVSKPICFAYLFGVNTINNQVNDDWNNCLCNIRTVLMNENDRFEGNKEIDPGQIFPFLLGKLHQELNQCKANYDSFCPLFTDQANFNQQNQNHIDFSNKNQAYNYFMQDFNKYNRSVISENFFGIMKTKTACGECKLISYTFNYYYFISFNLDLLPPKYANKPLNILDCIDIQNSICITLDFNKYYNCRKCNQITKHYQRRQFYNYPKYLVIYLERGYDGHNKTKISYSLDLNLTKRCDNPNSPNIYKLIGVIKRIDMEEKEHYISLYFDFRLNSWIYRDDSNIKKINSPFDVQQGIEVMFFYIGFRNEENPSGLSQVFQRQFSRMPNESSQIGNSIGMPHFSNSNNNININNINNMNFMNMPNNQMQMNNNHFGQYNQRNSSGNIFLNRKI